MGLSKKDLWENLKTTLAAVNKELAKPVFLDYPEELLLKLPMSLFREATWWLKDLPELLAIRKLRAYAKPEYWAAIEFDPDCEDLREIKLLREAQHDLNRAFRKPTRPRLFKKTIMQKEIRSVEA
jgi:hypothetical protein